jgi:hypothetical protein
MVMPRPRDPITQSQIDAAKRMPTPSPEMVPAARTFEGEMQSVRDAKKGGK